jgi:hypothetical protein
MSQPPRDRSSGRASARPAGRALCVTADPHRRRTLRRTLQAVGSAVEFADPAQVNDPSALVASLAAFGGEAPDMVVVDKEARRDVNLQSLGERFGGDTKIVVLGESLDEEGTVALLRQPALDHVISDSADPDDDELVVTAVKLARRDIFGLEKYLAWGVLVRDREVTGYDDKREALLEVAEYAKEAGARRQTVARIESVADELLMNALYDAPAVRFGVRPRIGERSRSGLGPLGHERALMRYACDGRYFALSVRDNYGELTKEAILDNLARARAERGTPREQADEGQGAGLGLYFILSSVTRFIANIQPGQTTEVVCLFDLKATGREAEGCKSLHIFAMPPAPPAPVEKDQSDPAVAPTQPPFGPPPKA